jgi:hypothetical protein
MRSRRGASRATSKQQNQLRQRSLRIESLESREMLSAAPMTFQVVDDAAANIAYRYAANGTPQGSSALVAANSAPRGVASMIGVEKTWVIDANRNVYIYNSTSGAILGSWSAGSMPNNATPEGIATDGTDIWIVDARSDKAYRYAGSASRLSGSQTAASSFSLASSNANAKDAVTDGYSLWVVDDTAKTDRVFKYNLTTNSLVGSWTIDSANKTPTGIALDPANIGDLWISDSGTDRVYKYTAAAGLNSGSLAASASFALAAGNGNAQGLVVPGRPWAETPYQVEWIKQFGTAADDWGRGVTTDAAGNVYLSGVVSGVTGGVGTPFLAQYDAAGNQNWMQQSAVNHEAVRVAADTLGNVFQVIGNASDGTPASLNCFSSNGTFVWKTDLTADENIFSVTVDNLGYAYMESYLWDGNISVRKFDGQTGQIVWQQQIATGGTNNSSGISYDEMGNLYLAAYTNGSLLGANSGGYDGVLIKMDTAGNVLWTREFGTPATDYAFIVSTDASGNAYISGQTYGSLGGPNAGDEDNFLAKYDGSGNQLWVKQWGTSGTESSSSSWIDSAGNIYRATNSNGALGGAHYGDSDIVVAKYDPSGNIMWATQLGTSGTEISYGGIWGDNQGNLYVAGRTSGSLGGANAGGDDVVLIKLSATSGGAASSSQSSVSRVWSTSPTTTNSTSRPSAVVSGATIASSSGDIAQKLSLLQAIQKGETGKTTGLQFSAGCRAVDAAFTQGLGGKWPKVLDELLASVL